MSKASLRAPKKHTGRRPDRRVQRTQRALHGALLALISERGWERVSVQDVCERADIGRSTFYLHFADKEELLLSGFGELRGQLLRQLAPADGEPLGFTIALLEHAREHEPLLKALIGRRTGVVVQRAFMELVRDLVIADLGSRDLPDTPLGEAAVPYVAGAFWELLRWWLEQRKGLSAAEAASRFKQLTMPVLRELRRSAGQIARSFQK